MLSCYPQAGPPHHPASENKPKLVCQMCIGCRNSFFKACPTLCVQCNMCHQMFSLACSSNITRLLPPRRQDASVLSKAQQTFWKTACKRHSCQGRQCCCIIMTCHHCVNKVCHVKLTSCCLFLSSLLMRRSLWFVFSTSRRRCLASQPPTKAPTTARA